MPSMSAPFEGTYATEFSGESYQSLLGELAMDGAVSDSYSVELAAGPFSPIESVPETGLSLYSASASLDSDLRAAARAVKASARLHRAPLSSRLRVG